MLRRFFAGLAVSTAAFTTPAMADFDSDVAKAYAPYRMALFATNKNDAEKSVAAIAKFVSLWDGLTAANGAEAPARYGGEADWPGFLGSIRAIAVEADDAAKNGDFAKSHEVLEKIRDELDSLRDRHGVRVFSSFVDAYHTEMERTMRTAVTPATWGSELAADLREKLGILAYLARDMASHAPAENANDPEFQELLKAVDASITGLRAALDANDAEAVAKALKMLKPPYAQLFLKFG